MPHRSRALAVCFAIPVALAAALPAAAQLPEYGPLELQARYASRTNQFRIPDTYAAFDRYTHVQINNRGDVAASLAFCIWYNGGVLLPGAYMDHAKWLALSNTGVLVWHGDIMAPPLPRRWGIARYDADAGTPLEFIAPDPPADNESFPVANDDGKIVFFSTTPPDPSEHILRWDPVTGQTDQLVAGGPAFSPENRLAQNYAGQVAAVNQADRTVVRFNPDGASVTVSPFGSATWTEFVDINSSGQVALRSSSRLLRSDGTTLTEIAHISPDQPINSFFNAPLAINDAGWVAFGARGSDGVEGIYLADGESIVRVAATGDAVMTDLGPARIHHFGDSGADINNAGDIAFFASLTLADSGFGAGYGILVLRAGGTCRGDWNGDGAVNSADISAFLTTWLASLNGGTLDGDFDGDMVVTSADIAAFLTAWIAALGC